LDSGEEEGKTKIKTWHQVFQNTKENSMIFPRLTLLNMEFEGIWGHYFAIGSE
jgi:hypothetical protein